MQVLVFDFWLLILAFLTLFSIFKKNALILLIAGLLFIAFGSVLTFEGLDVVNGITKSGDTFVFSYRTILPETDQLFAIIAIGSLPIGIAASLFSLVVLYTEMFKQYRLF